MTAPAEPAQRAEPPRPAAHLAEPARFWIRYAPRAWPGADGPWIDLATAGLGPAAERAGPADLPEIGGPQPLDDLLYLPLVPPSHAAARDAVARARLAAGTPVLLQAQLGAAASGRPAAAPVPPSGAVVVADPLAALLAGDLAALDRLPAGAAVVWPLVAGLTDDPALWEAGCGRLAAAGAGVVQVLALDLGPADRRRLVVWCGEAAFEPLFHRPPPAAAAARAFARTAARHGLAPFLARPAVIAAGSATFNPAAAANRRLAGELALAAELSARLDGPAGRTQALFAAARQADRTAYDLAALAREGNLPALTWLDAAGRRMVEESVAGAPPALLAELLAEYVGGEG